MPNRIAMITDSTSDIPLEWRQQYDLIIVPLTIVFGSEQYLDGVDLTPEEFYTRLGKERPLPTTSQPTPKAFLNAYHQASAGGAEEILCITISSAMSGTFESARRAGHDSPIAVHVVDGKNNSMGLGWQVIAAARAQENGGGLEEMLAAAAQVRDDMVYFISLDTIEYLAKGGRISDAARFLNSVLQIKPLILVKPETGTVGASLPARSRKAGIDGLYKEFFKRMRTDRPMHITVLHNDARPEAEELTQRVQTEYALAELFIQIVSPVLGVHTGPRAIALCGYSER